MRTFKEILRDINKLGNVSRHNIDNYISLLTEAKDNLATLKEVNIEKANKQKTNETKELVKCRKKYLKNEEKINSMYEYYTNMESGIKTSGSEIVYERYYLCKFIKSPNIKKQYAEVYNKYFVNIEDECYLKLNGATLVPIIAQNLSGEYKDMLSGKSLEDLSCEGGQFIKTKRINRNQLLEELKSFQENFGLYRKIVQDFQGELDLLKYQYNDQESVLRLNN